MLTVQALPDRNGSWPRQGVTLGEVSSTEALLALLGGRVGEFRVVGTTAIDIDLARPVGDDRRYFERIALAANGHRAPW